VARAPSDAGVTGNDPQSRSGTALVRKANLTLLNKQGGGHLWMSSCFCMEQQMSNASRFPLVPDKLWQPINPWTFYQQGAQLGFFNIDLGTPKTPNSNKKSLMMLGAIAGSSAISEMH
jgi:hypothetical protein